MPLPCETLRGRSALTRHMDRGCEDHGGNLLNDFRISVSRAGRHIRLEAGTAPAELSTALSPKWAKYGITLGCLTEGSFPGLPNVSRV
jgi:hypothetical protein